MNIQIVKKYLEVIKRATSLIENELGGQEVTERSAVKFPLEDDLEIATGVVNDQVVQAELEAAALAARQKHIESLMAINCWPEAVPSFFPQQVSDKDQKNRARAVLDTVLDRRIEGLKLLDYGCGDGWTTQEASLRGAKATGYDIVVSPTWKQFIGPEYTDLISQLPDNHYDIIFLYDVLDHAVDAEAVVQDAHRCLAPGGTVYVRCHPWTAKHATHLYKQGINKAYFHLFLTWDEIRDLINQYPVFTRHEKEPLEAYHWWFRDFEIVKERSVIEPVHEFFHVPAFKQLLIAEQGLEDVERFLKLMEVQFVDFKLVKKQ
jgi:SAM-dependent methyltransferase